MRIPSVGAFWFGLLVVLAPVARAQGQPRAVALARLQAVPDSSAPARRSWSEAGAVVGGVGGGLVSAVAFYHFTHRSGAVNNTSGTVGGTLVGFAIGAAGGALLGALVGSLVPKHKDH